MTPRRWIEYLVAILAGNGIYFAVLHPTLPLSLRHEPYRIDAGLLIDFACCVLVYAAIRLGAKHARRENVRRNAPPPPTRRENAASEAWPARRAEQASEENSQTP